MRRGFTLLEVLVATVIMAIAVTGLLSSLSTSMRNASRLIDADRSAMLAKEKMDELLLDTGLPVSAPIEGNWDPALTGGQPAGWRAQVQTFEALPGAPSEANALQRIELQVWWGAEDRRRTFSLEGYRPGRIPVAAGGPR